MGCRRGLVVAVAVAAVLTAGCGSSDPDPAASPSSTSTTVIDPVADPAVADCVMEFRTTRTASFAMEAATGSLPTRPEDLVGEYLANLPKYWDVDPTSADVAVPREGVQLPKGCVDGAKEYVSTTLGG